MSRLANSLLATILPLIFERSEAAPGGGGRYYELAQRHPEVPRLTPKQIEAVRYFNALAKVPPFPEPPPDCST